MGSLSLVLFDDQRARQWEPFALTRPGSELLFGALTLRERAERALGARCDLVLGAKHLVGFEEDGAPPVLGYDGAPSEGDRLFLLSRAVPSWDAPIRFEHRQPGPVLLDEQVVGWYAPDGSPPPPASFFEEPSDPTGHDSAAIRLRGTLLQNVWDIISNNANQIAADLKAIFPEPTRYDLGPGTYQWGGHPVIVGDSVRIEPGCAFDTTEGPIRLDDHSVVHAFTRLCGPLYVGPRSVILGGNVECSSIGPVCRIRGEFSTSVALGFTNKQHDGHIGHAYLGRWVNLGAETTNSDLKNNYGTVRLRTSQGEVDTGQIKLGSLLGDHVKTGIGLLLNTGTIVGAGSNLYGASLPPTYVEPFSWGSGSELVEYRLEKFLEVVERTMARRNVQLTNGEREQLRRAWQHARGGTEPG